jgi:hypothetical protein
MSKLIALRLPDDLAARLETRCSIRKATQTAVLLEAIERGWDEADSQPASVAVGPSPIPLNIPGIFPGSQLGKPLPAAAEEAPLELPMCHYSEWDSQTGESYACGLRIHSNKIRHTRGQVIR